MQNPDIPARLQSLEPLWGDWYVSQSLGEGSFGRVFRLERREQGRTYSSALKWICLPQSEAEVWRLRSESMSDADIRTYYSDLVHVLTREIELMSEMSGTSHILNYQDHKVLQREVEIGWDILIKMELLTPLSELLAMDGLKLQDVYQMGIDLSTALSALERRGIMHRDIKPDNTFVAKSGEYKLGDFGVSRTMEHTLTDVSRKGTPLYMAPEIYMNRAAGLSADIYSLGLVLYRLLNGNRMPFWPEDRVPSAQEREQALMRRLSGEALPPPKFGCAALKSAVLKACAFDPATRPNAAALRRDLESAMEREQNLAQTIVLPSTATESRTPPPIAHPQDDITRYATEPVSTPIRQTQSQRTPVPPRVTSTQQKPQPVRAHMRSWIAPAVLAGLLVVLVAGGAVLWGQLSGAKGTPTENVEQVSVNAPFADDEVQLLQPALEGTPPTPTLSPAPIEQELDDSSLSEDESASFDDFALMDMDVFEGQWEPGTEGTPIDVASDNMQSDSIDEMLEDLDFLYSIEDARTRQLESGLTSVEYDIVIEKDAVSDAQLTALFMEAIYEDGYDLHSIDVYRSESAFARGETLARLVQGTKGALPRIDRDVMNGISPESERSFEPGVEGNPIDTPSELESSLDPGVEGRPISNEIILAPPDLAPTETPLRLSKNGEVYEPYTVPRTIVPATAADQIDGVKVDYVIQDDQFETQVDEVAEYYNDYIGKNLSMVGEVLHYDVPNQDAQFAIVRWVVGDHDPIPTGFDCAYAGEISAEKAWVRVVGTLVEYEYKAEDGETFPALKLNVLSINNAQRSQSVQQPLPSIKPVSNVTVYYQNGSKYYHATTDCGSAMGMPTHTLAEAIDAGKRPCPYGCKGKLPQADAQIF